METCQTSNCINNPIAICLHCQQKLCVEHLLQHNEEMINKANKYCDEFNELTEQIEKLSFDEQFQSAQEDLYDWVNDQMKQLDKIYEQKLFELKQTHCDTNKQLKIFKQIQQTKLNDIQHRLFNSQLSKQISLEQLNRMNLAIEQLREDIHQFKTNQCSITLVNNDQMNYSYIPNIDIQFKKKISEENKTIIEVEPKCDKIKNSQLSVHAKPFEYIPKDQNYSSYSSNRQNNLTNRLFDEYNLMKSINQTM